jgi:hypothetical protein
MLSENGVEHTIETEGGLGESESLKENFIDSGSDTKPEVSSDTMYNWIRKHSGK